MVKLEGAGHGLEVISFLAERDIPVCAHLGLTPQSVMKLGGYRVQGREGEVAKPQGEIQNRYPDVFIGSYPFEGAGGFATNLVLRSRVPASLERAEAEVKALVETMTREGLATVSATGIEVITSDRPPRSPVRGAHA